MSVCCAARWLECPWLRGGREGGKEGGTLRGKAGRNEREKGNDIRQWTLIDRVNGNC